MKMVEQVTGAARRTVADWVSTYQKSGIEGLKPGWKGGNHCKLSAEKRVEFGERVQHLTPEHVFSGQDASLNAEFWSVETVAAAVEQGDGVRYLSRGSYRRLLIDAGFSFQQPEGIYRSRPSQAVIADFEADAEKSDGLQTRPPERTDCGDG